MKLQKSNGTHSLANLNQPHPKKIEIARLRPKVNNFVLKSKMTETSQIQSQFQESIQQQNQEETQEEILRRLRRIYAEGMRRLKNYQIQEGLQLFKTCTQKINIINLVIQKLSKELGNDHQLFIGEFSSLIKEVCVYALRLQQENQDGELGLMVLLWAEDTTNPVYQFEKIPTSRCLVYNNLGCIYRRIGKLQLALNSLEKALEIIQQWDVPNKSITYLNITAVLSQMGLHDKALSYAYSSLKECQLELTLFLRDENASQDDEAYAQRLKYIGISLHNIGVEEECQGQLEPACQHYHKSFEYMNKHFGLEDPLTQKFQSFWIKTKQKIEQSLNESKEKLRKQFLPRPGSAKKLTPSQTTQGFFGNRQLVHPKLKDESKAKTFYFRPGSSDQVASQPNLFNIKHVNPSKILRSDINLSKIKDKSVLNEPKEKEVQSKLSELNELNKIGILNWTDSENEDLNQEEQIQKQLKEAMEEEDDQAQLEVENTAVNKKLQATKQVTEQEQRDFRLQFLKKMTLVEAEDTQKKKQKQQIEAESQQNDKILYPEVLTDKKELDEKRLIKIQSYIKMKFQMRRFQRQQVEKKRTQKKEEFLTALKKIQKWVKRHLFQKKMREATRILVQRARCIKYPKKEMDSIIKMQRHVRLFLTYTNNKRKNVMRSQKGFLIIRTSQFQPKFMDEENIHFEHKQIVNKVFWFRLSITKPHRLIRLVVSPYDCKKCLKPLQQGFEMLIKIDTFYKTLVMFDQYVEHLRNQVNEDTNLTRIAFYLFQVSGHFVRQTESKNNQIGFELISPNELTVEDYLKKLGPLLEELIIIKENQKLIFLGFNDFIYSTEFVQEKCVVEKLLLPPITGEAQLKGNELILLVKIQSKIKGIFWRARATLIKQAKRKVQKCFTIKTVSNNKTELLRVFQVFDLVSKRSVLYCRIESTKKKTNELYIHDAITRQLGLPTVESFLEIYSVNINDAKLDFSEEGYYWIHKFMEERSKKHKVTLGMLHKSSNKIQKAIRRYLFIQQLKLRVINKKRQHGKIQDNIHSESLVRKVILQEEKPTKRAFYMNFILLTETIGIVTDDNSLTKDKPCLSFMQSKGAQIESIKQSIKILTKPMEHLYSREIIQPFYQQLFYHIDQTEILSIAQKMLEISRVIKGKQNTMKLDVKNLEEVQGLIVNEQKKTLDCQVEYKKDDTLEARRIFNLNTQRMKRLFKNSNCFEYVKQDQFSNYYKMYRNSAGPFHKMNRLQQVDNYFRQLWGWYESVKTIKQEDIQNKKDVKQYDQESISRYIRLHPYKSELGYGTQDPSEGYRNLHFLEDLLTEEVRKKDMQQSLINKEEQERNEALKIDQEKQAKMQKASHLLYADYCVISNQRVYLKIILNRFLDQLFITAQLEGNQQNPAEGSEIQQESTYQINVHKTMLLPGGKVNEKFLETHIDQLLLKQITIDDDGMYFVPEQFTQLKMLQEQILWEEGLQETVDVSTIAGGGPKDIGELFKMSGVNLSKTTCTTLRENNKQIIQMQVFEREETYDNEYLFNLSDNQLIITVYLKADVKVRKLYVIPVEDFQCSYLKRSVKEKTPDQLVSLLNSTLLAIENLFIIQQGRNSKSQKEIVTNFHTFQPFLATLFQEQFLIKIQNFLRAQKIKQHFKTQKQTKAAKVFLSSYVINQEGRFIQFKFSLIKGEYTIRFSMKELNTVDGNGNIVCVPRHQTGQSKQVLNQKYFKIDLLNLYDRQVMLRLISSLTDAQKDEFSRVDPEKWLDLQTLYSAAFYRKLFQPLITLVAQGVRITYPSISLMIVSFDKIAVPIVQYRQTARVKPNQKESNLYMLMNAVMKVQNAFKKLKQRQWFTLKTERKLQQEIKFKQLGKFEKRCIRKVDARLFIINVFKKNEQHSHQYTITFDLIPYTDIKIDRRVVKKRFRAFYAWDATKLLNIGSQNFYDYLIEQLYFNAGIVKFHETDFHSFDDGKIEPLDQQSKQITRVTTTRQSILETQTKKTFLDQLTGPEKLVYHNHSLTGNQGDENVPETIYNVIYTGRQTLKVRSKDEIQENTVSIEVNLDNVRKLYPTLNTYDDDAMKVIGQQLIEGVRINSKGELMVDQKKINPTFITITENRINKQIAEPKSELQKQEDYLKQQQYNQRNSFAKILVKKTTYFQHNKYLIVINYIERKISKILQQAVDQVFEEFEVLYQILGNNLVDGSEKSLIWELSPEEAQTLSHLTEKNEIAHYMVKRILIINGKFIYLVQDKQDMLNIRTNYQNVILFLEKGIRPIQHKFRNKLFSKNYRKHREEIQQWKDGQGNFLPQVAFYSLESLKSSQQFVVLCGEDKSKHLQFTAWNVQTFERFDIELPKMKYSQLITRSKQDALRTLGQFVEYQSDLNELIFVPPAMEQIIEIFQSFKQTNPQFKDKEGKQIHTPHSQEPAN